MIARRLCQRWATVSAARRCLSSSVSRGPLSLHTHLSHHKLCPPVLRFSELRISHFVKRSCYSTLDVPDVKAVGVVEVPLAQTGEGIAECELLKWFVKEGDQVEEFQPLCEVQSDKATIEITSRYEGRVAEMFYNPGDIVKVGETLLKMLVEDLSVPTQKSEDIKSAESIQWIESEQNKQSIGGVISTPAVRDLAKQYDININDVIGTGKNGRVLKDDILKYAVEKGQIEDSSASSSSDSEHTLGESESHADAADGIGPNYEDKIVTLRGFQRKMVQSMSMAARVPHFHYVEDINCDALVKLKDSFKYNNSDLKIKYTFLPILIKSLSLALSKYPSVNSCFIEDSLEVIFKGSHNIGVAMATQYGLVVPNIKNVQSLSIMEITKELSRLQQLATDNKLSPKDISGGTITLSNIGAIGGKYGSPLLNLPEVCIIAIGRIQKVPQFADGGNVYPASVMMANIGADHRVLDGATVARFCNEWKKLIENPELLTLYLR
ncbi:lipoamide acyltransferase component of branched-chain alpha-keto acid dehydrogenase complex, mitochondrial [Cannabis sativa]|uniref:Dihydrolipoamide acetyltransferase component of pyruvate dehydrogenase complex n=1 Tax=Cannabis sativa TaxID=3483 RepID=A0A7J6EB26_CANSA|nr:lipoamide acyltransferase component of branched-chain alpha-keto acid dehydrogenase complex, mitochondrial [Cannabis sativa]KAF4355648.1 hypothetical protein F8388_013065 [Cannabis sativa]